MLRGAYIKKKKKLHLLCDHDEIWILYVKLDAKSIATIKSTHFDIFMKFVNF